LQIELRPASSAGNSGFILDPKEIIPTGEEIFPAVRLSFFSFLFFFTFPL
jgi:hypothetical protein